MKQRVITEATPVGRIYDEEFNRRVDKMHPNI
ncbi:unnamed protein product, partial [Rotaria sp. Silwood2]